MAAEFSQDKDRPEAPLASAPSVTSHTLAPRRARWYALETPITPPPMTATLSCDWLFILLRSINLGPRWSARRVNPLWQSPFSDGSVGMTPDRVAPPVALPGALDDVVLVDLDTQARVGGDGDEAI